MLCLHLVYSDTLGGIELLPAEQSVVVLMSDDFSRAQSYGSLLARLQAVFTQLHSVVVAVTVGWQMTWCPLWDLDTGIDCVNL